jgi:hypothetical protein
MLFQQSRQNPVVADSEHAQHKTCNRERIRPAKVTLNFSTIKGIQQILYRHKIVLSFDGIVSSTQAKD